MIKRTSAGQLRGRGAGTTWHFGLILLLILNTANCSEPSPQAVWFTGESDSVTVKDGSFAAWRGRAVDIGGTWAATDSIQHLINSPSWSIAHGTTYGDLARIDYAAGGPLAGETWAEAAGGKFDLRWAAQLREMQLAWGLRPASNFYIRFAHEMNGNWYSWSVAPSDVTNYITAWRRFHKLVQMNFPGANLVWCANSKSTWNYDIRTLWPGDAYVDIIGVDAYNNYPWVNSDSTFSMKTEELSAQGGPVGIERWRTYALAHGKPLAIPEWANASVNNGGGGGDAPTFMRLFHAWLAANGGGGPGNVLYEILFNVSGYGEHYELFRNGSVSSMQIKSAAVYQSLWRSL